MWMGFDGKVGSARAGAIALTVAVKPTIKPRHVTPRRACFKRDDARAMFALMLRSIAARDG